MPPTPLETENAALKADAATREANEAIIRQKMAAGLTREQALASLANQTRFNALNAKTKKAAK
jgi:hypothetical protein